MDTTPPPVALAEAIARSRAEGRAATLFADAGVEVKFAARPTRGPQVPHARDELYIVTAGTARYRVADAVSGVGPGDLLFCAARVPHGFEEASEDFAVWVVFYGPEK